MVALLTLMDEEERVDCLTLSFASGDTKVVSFVSKAESRAVAICHM